MCNLGRAIWGVALGLVLSLALVSCDTRIPVVTPEFVAHAQRQDPSVSTASLEHARSLYVKRCGSCHALSDPQAYDEPQWRHWMQRMAPKARLDAEQSQAVLGFILAARNLSAGDQSR